MASLGSVENLKRWRGGWRWTVILDQVTRRADFYRTDERGRGLYKLGQIRWEEVERPEHFSLPRCPVANVEAIVKAFHRLWALEVMLMVESLKKRF